MNLSQYLGWEPQVLALTEDFVQDLCIAFALLIIFGGSQRWAENIATTPTQLHCNLNPTIVGGWT